MPINKQEYEIRVLEITKKLLSQWKAILIVALLVMLLISGLKYHADINAYKEAVDRKKQTDEMSGIPTEEQIVKVLESLPAEERADVEYYIQQKEWLDKEIEYCNNSILLKVDPTSQRTLMLDYYIASEDTSNSIAATLAYSYSSFINNEEIIEGLRQIIDPDIESKYISELISTPVNSNGGNNYILSADDGDIVLEVKIVLPEYVDAKAVESVITKAIKEYSSELQNTIGAHTIRLIRFDEARLYNSIAANNKNSIISNINSIETVYLKNTEAALSDNQKAAASAITSIKNADKTAKEMGVNDEVDANNEPVKPGFSKRFAVLGFLLGIMLYVFIYILNLLFKTKVLSASQIESYTSSRFLGDVYYADSYKGLDKLMHSNAVNNILYKEKLDTDKQIEKTTTSVEAACKHAGISKVALVHIPGEIPEDLIKELANGIQNRGITVDVIDYDDDSIETELINLNNVIVIAESGCKATDLKRLASLLSAFQIKQIGSIYLGRV